MARVFACCSVRDAVGGAAERAAGRAGAVPGPGRRVPLQDAAGGAHVPAHAAAPPAPAPLASTPPYPHYRLIIM